MQKSTHREKEYIADFGASQDVITYSYSTFSYSFNLNGLHLAQPNQFCRFVLSLNKQIASHKPAPPFARQQFLVLWLGLNLELLLCGLF
jgi:hypothetical protein